MTTSDTQTQKRALKPMESMILGRIDAIRRHEGNVYTRVLTPAPDAYSRPQVIEIRSKTKLGERQEEVRVLCRLGGYTRKPFRYTDKETGEVLSIVPVDHTLDLVED